MKRFWLGVACGFAGAVAVLAIWAVVATALVDQKLDRTFAEHEAKQAERTKPLLDPPELPEGWQSLDLEAMGDIGYDWSLESMEGEEVPATRFEDRVVLFDFWATWCSPCVAELPRFAKLEAAIPDDRRISLALVTDEDREPVRKFSQQFVGLADLPVFFARSGIPGAIWPSVRPAAFIVDCQGRVVFRHVGPADWGSEEVVRFLERLEESTCREA